MNVTIAGGPGSGLTIEVRNPIRIGAGESRTPASGLGLVGLTERTALAGGRLTHRISPRETSCSRHGYRGRHDDPRAARRRRSVGPCRARDDPRRLTVPLGRRRGRQRPRSRRPGPRTAGSTSS
ncbi:hypothetical protein [Aeromicrobium sp. UC242_57]|uniref:hypothetical protein n=1 Tax=Aeromicrobium sp. UC242_57 TaxID=3374624 RepID=UPI0037AC5284